MAVATKSRTNGKVRKLTKAEQYNVDFAKIVARLAKSKKGEVSVDKITDKLGMPPQGGKALGALINASARKLSLKIVAVEKSTRPSRKGSYNAVWKKV